MSEILELPCSVNRTIRTWSEWKTAIENAGVRDGDLVDEISLSCAGRPVRARRAVRFGAQSGSPEAWFLD